MANSDKPSGLVPVGTIGSHSYNGQVKRMYIQAGYGTALFIGDPVIPGGSSDSAGVPDIQAAGASGIPIGVITGFEATKSDLTVMHSPASTEGYALVDVDPNTLYEIQDDGNTAMAVTSVGLNADFIAGAGDATSGRSGYELDSGGTTTPATTATLALRIEGASQKPDNDLTLANAKWIVRINTHQSDADAGV